MMCEKEMVKKAADVLRISEELAIENSTPIPDNKSIYVSNPVRGGGRVIIVNDGTYLFATSGVSFADHMQAYVNGKRSEKQRTRMCYADLQGQSK